MRLPMFSLILHIRFRLAILLEMDRLSKLFRIRCCIYTFDFSVNISLDRKRYFRRGAWIHIVVHWSYAGYSTVLRQLRLQIDSWNEVISINFNSILSNITFYFGISLQSSNGFSVARRRLLQNAVFLYQTISNPILYLRSSADRRGFGHSLPNCLVWFYAGPP